MIISDSALITKGSNVSKGKKKRFSESFRKWMFWKEKPIEKPKVRMNNHHTLSTRWNFYELSKIDKKFLERDLTKIRASIKDLQKQAFNMSNLLLN